LSPTPPTPKPEQVPASLPRRGNAVTRWLGRTVLRLLGWRTEGGFPDTAKMVVIAAPHSSALDFVVGIAFVLSLGIRVRFIGKAELFRGPLGWLMRWLGGIPVDRADPGDIVQRVVDEFARAEALVLGIAPEGTRRFGAPWKTGFHRIAVQAGIPIVPGYFDWSRKTVGLLPPFAPSGDVDRDVEALRNLYRRYPRADGRTLT
jgi:1-acyl-sn-glycerol-3-phosphate acyltransferase